jgi:hypothetical protein
VQTHQQCIIKCGAWQGADARGDALRFPQPYRERLSSVRVDAIGIGHGFALHLRDHRFPVELINVSQPCRSRPQLRENDPARRFANQKAQFYRSLADSLEQDELEELIDEMTIGQLAGILCEIDSHGRERIEPKEKARERGVPSPDRAAALMLALCKPPQTYEFRSTRDLGKQGAGLEDDDPMTTVQAAAGTRSRAPSPALASRRRGVVRRGRAQLETILREWTDFTLIRGCLRFESVPLRQSVRANRGSIKRGFLSHR